MFAGKKSAQIREILISESAWEEMTCLFAPSLTMWGHYGNAEKGFAIVYETNDGDISLESDIEIFPSATKLSASSYSLGMSRFSKAKLLEVAYKNKPVRANAFRKLIPTFSFSDQEDFYDYRETLLADLQKYNENDIGRVKYTDWKYEKGKVRISRSFLPKLTR